MAGKPPHNSFRIQLGDRLSDFAVTMTCWTYFTLGFVLFFLSVIALPTCSLHNGKFLFSG